MSGADLARQVETFWSKRFVMLHALRHRWQAFETNDDAVTMFIGPSKSAAPLEVGVVTDDDGTAVIHSMRVRPKFLRGLGKQ